MRQTQGARPHNLHMHIFGAALQSIIGGFDQIFLSNLSLDSVSGGIPETVFITFQMTFAIITPALIIGEFAERMKFSAIVINILGISCLLITHTTAIWF